MNRLVIIGNGFDLAHGLPTSYGGFLNWIWKNFNTDIDTVLISELFEIDRNNFAISDEISNFSEFEKCVFKRFSRGAYRIEQLKSHNSTFIVYYKQYSGDAWSKVFSFNNKLFELINI